MLSPFQRELYFPQGFLATTPYNGTTSSFERSVTRCRETSVTNLAS